MIFIEINILLIIIFLLYKTHCRIKYQRFVVFTPEPSSKHFIKNDQQPFQSHKCLGHMVRVTWWRIDFIPVVSGRPPNPEWPHHISHRRLGWNGVWTRRHVCGTVSAEALRLSAHESAERNSPMLKKELSWMLPLTATPNPDLMLHRTGQCASRSATVHTVKSNLMFDFLSSSG
jgi:hypothetical protein